MNLQNGNLMLGGIIAIVEDLNKILKFLLKH